MQRVSNEFKEIMNRPFRNRFIMSVSLGVVNKSAQSNAKFDGECEEWSNTNYPFQNRTSFIDYAMFEENYIKADGSLLFMPEDEEPQYLCTNYVSKIGEDVVINFNELYDVKGLTIDFGNSFPTELQIETNRETYTYTNDSSVFVANTTFGTINQLKIRALGSFAETNRLHLRQILMGVGMVYENENLKNANFTEYVSPISAELPSSSFSFSVIDYSGIYDPDNPNSYIEYLNQKQDVGIVLGLEKDNEDIEYVDIANLYLNEWSYKNGELVIKATDKFSFLDMEYSLCDVLHNRTAYDECERILQFAGLTSDEYIIDDYLKTVNLTNPLPKASCKQCLQLLCNVSRCKMFQDTNGLIRIETNFANLIDKDDITVSTRGATTYGNVHNLLNDGNTMYAYFSKNMIKLDGSLMFIQENEDYLPNIGVMRRANYGDDTPITIKLEYPIEMNFYSLDIDFAGMPPRYVMVRTYVGNVFQSSVQFFNLKEKNTLEYDFLPFDKAEVIVYGSNEAEYAVYVTKCGFGSISGYDLTRQNMLDEPVGYVEKQIKNINVKVYTYENDDKGKPKVVEEHDYVKEINPTGEERYVDNKLVDNENLAELLADWIGNHYANNVSYTASYRGDPRLHASDIITYESKYGGMLQTEIEECTLTFDGGLKGNLKMRKAINMIGGE